MSARIPQKVNWHGVKNNEAASWGRVRVQGGRNPLTGSRLQRALFCWGKGKRRRTPPRGFWLIASKRQIPSFIYSLSIVGTRNLCKQTFNVFRILPSVWTVPRHVIKMYVIACLFFFFFFFFFFFSLVTLASSEKRKYLSKYAPWYF